MKELTGRFHFREDGGKLILQVEEVEYVPAFNGGDDSTTWRDASVSDLLDVQFDRGRDSICKASEPIMQAGRLGG